MSDVKLRENRRKKKRRSRTIITADKRIKTKGGTKTRRTGAQNVNVETGPADKIFRRYRRNENDKYLWKKKLITPKFTVKKSRYEIFSF